MTATSIPFLQSKLFQTKITAKIFWKCKVICKYCIVLSSSDDFIVATHYRFSKTRPLQNRCVFQQGNAVCLVYFNMKGFKSGKISYVDWCYSLYVWEEDGKINKNEKTYSSESCQRVSVQTEGLDVFKIAFQNFNEGQIW